MDLSTYKFPEVTQVDLAFSTFDTPKELVDEAIARNPKKGMEKFSDLFFNGGEVEFKEDVKGTWKENAFMYARSLMGSFTPKHESKELVVGMIFEECLVL
jgi:hypothetical protein